MTIRIVTEARRTFLAALAAAALTSSCAGWDKTPATGSTATRSTAAAPAGTDNQRSTVVYVEDHTGGAWPVDVAVRQWAAGVKTRSVRYGSCPKHARCVKVREGGGLDSRQIGKTYLFVTKNIWMNRDYAALPYAQRLAAVCHELGHALGLTRHNEDPDSCMNAEIREGTSTRPGKRDLAELNTPGGNR